MGPKRGLGVRGAGGGGAGGGGAGAAREGGGPESGGADPRSSPGIVPRAQAQEEVASPRRWS